MEKKNYLMRSLMFVPGHSDKMIVSASKSDADVILLDLEDSVPYSNKQLARETIKKHVDGDLLRKYNIFIRINEIESGLLLKDVIQLSIDGVEGFLLSKTNTASDIIFLDKLLSVIEIEKDIPNGTFKIIPILETAASIINANDIAQASERVVSIGFGSEDFVSDLGGIRDFGTNSSIFTPRTWVAMVARANNIIPIDAAYIKVHDLIGLEEHLKVGKTLGYEGMWTLHPKQNALANQYYGPSKSEVNEAKEILALANEAEELNKGVAIINGKFIGPPLVIKANKIMERFKQISINEN